MTYSGRWLGLDSPVEMMKWQKNNAIRVETARNLSETELKGRIAIGVLADREQPSYCEEYEKLL